MHEYPVDNPIEQAHLRCTEEQGETAHELRAEQIKFSTEFWMIENIEQNRRSPIDLREARLAARLETEFQV